MSKEKRGGARLDKNMTAKAQTPNVPKTKPQEQRARGAGLSRKKKTVLIVALSAVGVILLALLVKGIFDALFNSGGLLDGLPDIPSYEDTIDPDIDGPIRSEADAKRKEEFYTFLLVGRDTGGGGNTDTIMFCSYDIPNQKLNVMSIPRDTIVDARHPDSNKRINGVWNLGLYYAEKGSKKEGIDYLKEAVGDMTGIVPDFHVIVNWEAFGRLVDAIGGVDFEVPFEMKYKDPTQNLVIDQAAGYRHLSGDDAMQVVRWRHNNSFSVQYADADLGRIRTQQALMKQIIKKCLTINNAGQINDLAEIFADEVETDLTVGNLLAFAQRAIFGGLDMENVVFTTMPNRAANGGTVQAQPEELLGILNESFSPYLKALDMSELRVLQRGSNGYYVYQGTGTGSAPASSSGGATQPTAKPQTASQAPTTQSAAPSPSDRPTREPSPSAESSAKPSAQPSTGPSGHPSGGPSGRPGPSEEEPPASSPAPSAPTAPPATQPPAVEPTHDPGDMGIPMD